MNFKKYIESQEDENAILNGMREGDSLAFLAYMDFLKEEGRKIPAELKMWKRLPNLSNMHSRWMLRRDMPEVLMMEKIGSKDPWDEGELLRHLRNRELIGRVVVGGKEERVLGYCVYSEDPNGSTVHRILVHPLIRNKGVGGRILQELRSRAATGVVRSRQGVGTEGFYKKYGVATVDSSN